MIKTYPVATGRTEDLTPEGTFPIVVKINKPGWKNIPGGDPRNPLGEKWMGLSVNGDKGRTYGIHGTNHPESIGQHASSGCIRMAKDDLIELYNIVPEGTPVWIHKGVSTGKWEGDPSYSVQPSSGHVKVVVDQASVMTGPSLGAFEIQKAQKETIFEVTGIIQDWYKIKLPNGKYAFIQSSNVTKVSDIKDPVQLDQIKDAKGKIMITASLANIRSNPSLDAPILQRVKSGTTITLTGEGKEWYRVRLLSGYTAYVHKSVAKVVSTKQQESKAKVIVDQAKLLNAPAEKAAVLEKVNKNTILTVVGQNDQYYIVKYKDTGTAFIKKSDVKPY